VASQIACQLYTLRDFAKTPADIAKTLARVRKIGYEAVQVSGMGQIDAKELAKILKDNGLTCCATHVGLDKLRDQVQLVVDEHKLWGCELTAIGGWGWQGADEKGWTDFARQYDEIARKYASTGVRIGYHNHNHELVRFGNRTALEIIGQTAPSVWMEIDTYWITAGGGDPAAFVRKYKDRIPAVHFKDMAVAPDRKQMMAEVGKGNLNWHEIIKACREAGVKWYIIEQDDCNGRDPFESVEESLRNLKAMGVN